MIQIYEYSYQEGLQTFAAEQQGEDAETNTLVVQFV